MKLNPDRFKNASPPSPHQPVEEQRRPDPPSQDRQVPLHNPVKYTDTEGRRGFIDAVFGGSAAPPTISPETGLPETPGDRMERLSQPSAREDLNAHPEIRQAAREMILGGSRIDPNNPQMPSAKLQGISLDGQGGISHNSLGTEEKQTPG